MPYEPSAEILDAYARVLVRCAPRRGKGICPGDVVYLVANDDARPLYVAVRNEILRAGGTCISGYQPAGTNRERIELSSLEQLAQFPRAYRRGLASVVDHELHIISSTDLHELEGVDPAKLLADKASLAPYNAWMEKKEAAGDYTWCVALYGTEAMAAEVGISLADYWEQIIKACYLDDPDPVARTRESMREIDRVQKKLTSLKIESVHVLADGVDLTISLGEQRQWVSGEGFNVPSFEIFTSPDWRGTEGIVSFTEPLYYCGSLIEDVTLRFEAGEVVEATARTNEPLLQTMLAADPGASRVGEFSLTDGRLSRIDRFMAEVLYDENRGGPEGNFHIAVGSAYKEAYTGVHATMRKRDWQKLGFNESAVHADLVSTARRTVTATLAGGEIKLIYRDGQFTI